ncbi:SitI3 family protein [Kitasatospora sp. NPDC057965]|uniref:SitI3 family protein n=1 Tax=Kitasatospora sp. NPDC057965 TaxID=3346291 RepID=UPI0036DF35CA
MSISHGFNLATSMSVTEVADTLNDVAQGGRLFDATTQAADLLSEGVATRFGTWIRVFSPNPRPWNPLVTDLRITPTVSVVFRLDKTTDLRGQEDDVVRLVSGLLERIPGDAVLQYHYETVWLLRRGDELSLNERDDLWPADRLAVVPRPFSRETHEFSDED